MDDLTYKEVMAMRRDPLAADKFRNELGGLAQWVVPTTPEEVVLTAALGPFGKAAAKVGRAALPAAWSVEADAADGQGGLAQAARDPRQYARALWYALTKSPTQEAYNHAKVYNNNARVLARQLQDVSDGSEYDVAKNYLGGYDWGYRMHDDPETAADMARAYQLRDYLLGNKADAEGDFEENVAGVYAGAAAKQRGDVFDEGALRRLALEFARANRRK